MAQWHITTMMTITTMTPEKGHPRKISAKVTLNAMLPSPCFIKRLVFSRSWSLLGFQQTYSSCQGQKKVSPNQRIFFHIFSPHFLFLNMASGKLQTFPLFHRAQLCGVSGTLVLLHQSKLYISPAWSELCLAFRLILWLIVSFPLQ